MFQPSSWVPKRIQTPASTPQLPFKRPQIPSNRDHKGLNRGTLGGLGVYPAVFIQPRSTVEAKKLEYYRLPTTKPTKEGAPANITINLHFNLLEPTVMYTEPYSDCRTTRTRLGKPGVSPTPSWSLHGFCKGGPICIETNTTPSQKKGGPKKLALSLIWSLFGAGGCTAEGRVGLYDI